MIIKTLSGWSELKKQDCHPKNKAKLSSGEMLTYIPNISSHLYSPVGSRLKKICRTGFINYIAE